MARTPTRQQEYEGGYTPANGSGITARKIKERWEESQKATTRERHNYWVNTAFVANEQYVKWRGEKLEEAPREDDRLRMTENRLWPSLRTLTGKLLKRPLAFQVPPTSADDASAQGARIATAVATDLHHRHKWEQLRHRGANLALKGGIAVLCVDWDPKAGTPLGTTSIGKHFGTGDTCETVLSVDEVATEPGSRDLETAAWWIKGTALPSPVVRAMYPDKLTGDPPADASASLTPMQRRLLDGGTTTKLTRVLTYYERPSKDNAQGVVAVVVDGRIVDGPHRWDFPFTDRNNCAVIRETAHDHDWLGDTILSAAIGPQVALNHAVTKIAEHMKWAADAKLAVPDSAGEQWDEISDVPEVVTNYGAQGNPEWITPPSMPSWWQNEPERCKQAIDDTLGVHDISRGEAPTGVDAGIALSLLAEQDDTPIGLLAKEMAEAFGRFMSMCLAIYEDKVTEPRRAVVERPGQAPETIMWSGADLQGQTTAVVPLDAVAPRSDAAQRAWAVSLKGMFPELDIKTFAKIADLPDADDLVQAVDEDVAKARRENAEMAAGNICIPADFDNHAVHINEHNRFRKSARYEALESNGADGPKDIIDAHVLGHEVEAAREAAEQLARAQVSPALAAAPQANEPPMAGEPDALAMMQQARNEGAMAEPGVPGAAPPSAAQSDQPEPGGQGAPIPQ